MISVAVSEIETKEAVPKWYTEANPKNFSREIESVLELLDEVRTAMLDYPEPDHILWIRPGCVEIQVQRIHVFSVYQHLVAKGLSPEHKGEHYKELAKEATPLDTWAFLICGRI